MKLAAFLLASLGFLWGLSARAPTAAAAQPDRITVIGDSVLTAVQWNAQPRSILERGFPAVDLDIAVCRRLTGSSCPFEGERPQNLVDTVQALGDAIGTTVVVEVGYNDPEAGFADAVDASVEALLAAGVERILWVNYHDFVPRYARMNAVLVPGRPEVPAGHRRRLATRLVRPLFVVPERRDSPRVRRRRRTRDAHPQRARRPRSSRCRSSPPCARSPSRRSGADSPRNSSRVAAKGPIAGASPAGRSRAGCTCSATACSRARPRDRGVSRSACWSRTRRGKPCRCT